MEPFCYRRKSKMRKVALLLMLCGFLRGVQGDICPEVCGDQDVPPCSWRNGGKYTLTCENRQLEKIPALTRDPTSSSAIVTVAHFDGNQLSLDGKLSDLGYKDVQEMSFKGCMIDDIPDTAFYSLTALRVLELRNNLLTSIETADFRNLQGLTFLDLSHNHITHIDIHAFDTMRSLVKLDISNNKLHVLQIPGLGAAPQSRLMPRLSEIVLNDNPWRCNCDLGPLYQDMMTRRLSPGAAQCHHGEELISWSQLPPENFTCAPQLLTVTPHRLVDLGSDLTLECRFQSNPAPTFVFWKLNGVDLPQDNVTNTDTVTNNMLMTQTRTRLKLFTIAEEDLGEYQCHATNSEQTTSASVRILVKKVLNPYQDNLGLIIGLVVSLIILLGLVALAVFCFRRWKTVKDDDDDDSTVHNESSYAILDTSNSLPSMRKEGSDINWTNPLPKPPRTGVYSVMSVIESSTLGRKPKINMEGIVPTDRDRFLSHYVSNQHLATSPPVYQSPIELQRPDHLEQMEMLSWIPSRPGSRASIGTASTLVSHHPSELHSQSFNFPAPTRTVTHPPAQARPGYVTLPRRPRSRPLTPSPSIPLEPLGHFGQRTMSQSNPLESRTMSPSIPLESKTLSPSIPPLESLGQLGPRTMGDGSSFHNIASVQSPAMDRLTLPHLVNNNNNVISDGKEEGGYIVLNKSQEMSETEESIPNISFTRSEDSPPSRPILDTIPEQD